MSSTTTLPAYYYDRPFSSLDGPVSSGRQGPAPQSFAPQTFAPQPTAPRTRLDQMRYWVGAAITAVVAALVGLVVTHGIAHVPVLAQDNGMLTPVHAVTYGLIAAGVAILAAALYNAMLHIAPRPTLYYCWLTGLLTVLATLIPFTMSAAHLSAQVALAGMNLLVGLVIVILVPFAAQSATVRS
jgi:Family of unknown function (DUF6069)